MYEELTPAEIRRMEEELQSYFSDNEAGPGMTRSLTFDPEKKRGKINNDKGSE